jgi:nicotinate-nucleotide adenylyltransferase
MKNRIGIYSGTFDPIHVGHITFARETLKACSLDKIVFLPEPEPREKSDVTDIVNRVKQIKEAIKDEKSFKVLEPNSSQFTTSETLPMLQTIFKDADLTLLLGSDIVRTFPDRWQNLDVLLKEVSLAIGIRTGDEPSDIIAILENLQKEYSFQIHYTLIQTIQSHIASSHIRKANS